MTKARLLLTASAAALLLSASHASKPTAYIDIHKITSFTNTGSLETGYLFRVPASESTFGGKPPKAPKWATHHALTGGDALNSKTRADTNANDSSGTDHSYHHLKLPPSSDSYLCMESKGISDYTNPAGNAASAVFDPDTLLSGYEGSYILVPRGHCTFESKARSAQRLGAMGVIVRNTLDSRYGLVDEEMDVTDRKNNGPHWENTKWPVDKRDYDCGNNGAANHFGLRAEVDVDAFSFSPAPYDGSTNNALLTGTVVDGNLCAQTAMGNFEKSCPSERCLLTGRNATEDGSKLEACCAWDHFLRMSSDGDDDGDAIPQSEEEKITIPALFVTMENGEELYDLVMDAEVNSNGSGQSVQFVHVVPYQKWYPNVHYSTVLVWALAVFTLWISSYMSAREYRSSWKKISKAVANGTLVFQRSASNSNNTTGGGRERANTDDTVDLADENVGELQLAQEVEMTNQATAGQNVEGAATTAAAANTEDRSSFTIEEADDFVGNPTSPKSGDAISNEALANNNDGSFAPAEEQQEPPPPANPFVPEEGAAAPATPQQQRPYQQVNLQSNSTTAETQNMELNGFHAILFVIAASCFLFILFFFNLYKVVRVIYGLGGAVAMNHVMFFPLYTRLCTKYIPDRISSKLQSAAFGNLPGCRGVYFKWIELLSSSTCFALSLAWIIVGFSTVQPMNNAYYWILQDIMGVCFCILILGLIHINSIMIAAILLSFVFIYDVFYVLISPLIFGSSVMIDVATGGASDVDQTFCEKYPSDSRCRGTLAPLPMLLAFPWFGDYRGGFSMIGLGDVILPGLLISFAARYDAARSLVKKCNQAATIQSTGNAAGEEVEASGGATGGTSRKHYQLGRIKKALFRGYFGPLMIAYAVGLILAYLAVWLMQRGQPALLYLVPTCLGTTLFLGWKRRELSDLWTGPKIMRKANRMVVVAGRIPKARPSDPNVAETSEVV